MPGPVPVSTFGAAPSAFQPMAFPGYTLVPTGGNVFYVRSTGAASGDPSYLRTGGGLYTTLGAALALCRANSGDLIVVLPGHSESVTTTPTFVAGVKILGFGYGVERPTFTWTATTSNWAINVANVAIQNCILNLDGAIVANAITVTGTDCTISDCDIRMASSAILYCTVGIDLQSGATRAKVLRNYFRGSNLGLTQAGVRIGGLQGSAAAAPANVTVDNNYAQFATWGGTNTSGTAGGGMVVVFAGTSGGTITQGPQNFQISNNILRNIMQGTVGLGTAQGCILIQDTGTAVISDGVIAGNWMAEPSAFVPGGTAGTTLYGSTGLIFSGTNATVHPVGNWAAKQFQRSGIQLPVNIAEAAQTTGGTTYPAIRGIS